MSMKTHLNTQDCGIWETCISSITVSCVIEREYDYVYAIYHLTSHVCFLKLYDANRSAELTRDPNYLRLIYTVIFISK
jgi:hypothetical protein